MNMQGINLFQKLQRTNYSIPHRLISGLNLWTTDLTSTIKHQIEEQWSKQINAATKYDEDDTTRQKYYVLSMFPYPSGRLHMGHVRVYTISDTVARFQRMNGKNVFHPIGWDAFGLPAENAAIERQILPDEWTKQNIAYMKSQLQHLGCSFEWDRELATCDPDYYKWTQDLFLKLFDAGLVYQKKAYVNWDPVDKTVLADEQVDENGCSWRSGAKVERKLLRQWFIRTTYFAKDLLDGLNDPLLDDWRDIIKLQKHWIGDCSGVAFDFKLKGTDEFVTVWTERPEFIEYAKFVAVNKSNHLATFEGDSVDDGTKILHIKAENPFNKQMLPIFVTDDIEYQPLTNIYLGIPVVFEKDSLFAQKYNIPFTYFDTDSVNVHEAQNRICNLAKEQKFGGYWTSAKLKDWLISRQRYWGTPIPIIHCEKCGPQPVPRQNLPVPLPKINRPNQYSGSQLKECADWVNSKCPKCSNNAKRETDTMDTFVDSSWYYLRYIDNKNTKEMFSKDKANKLTPVDLYIGGKEHAVLHLYYSRFIHHFLHSLNLVPHREPFKKLLVQGMVMGRCYRIKGSGQYLPEDQVQIIDSKRNKAVDKNSGKPVVMSWEKMSKSKHNGVDPSDMFKEYGIDTTRLLILADVAPRSHRNWNNNTFPGVINWQKRLWITIQEFLKHRNNLPELIENDKFKAHDDYMFDSRNYYVKGVTFNYCVSQQFSVAISKMQGLTNSIRKCPPAVFAHSLQFERALACQIILLAPMAPHFALELWAGFVSAPNRLSTSNEILWDKNVLEQKWPVIDFNYNLDLICQINGEESAVVKMPRYDLEQLNKSEAVEIALKQKEVQDLLLNKNILDVSFTVHSGYESVVNFYTQRTAKYSQQDF